MSFGEITKEKQDEILSDGQTAGLSQEARENLRTEFISLGGIVTSLPDIAEVRDFTQVYIPSKDASGKQLFDIWQMLDGRWYNLGQVAQTTLSVSGSSDQFDTNQTITISTVNTFTEITLGWTNNLKNNIEFSGGVYTIQIAGDYLIIWSLSVLPSVAGKTYEFGIGKNTVKINRGWTQEHLSNTTEEESLGASAILDLKTGDKISLGVINETDSNNIAIQHASFTIVKIR